MPKATKFLSNVVTMMAIICISCGSGSRSTSTHAGGNDCATIVATSLSSHAKEPVAPTPDPDAESRIRTMAEAELPCDEQRVSVRQVYGHTDAQGGSSLNFYQAERCGAYQVYRVSSIGDVQPEGVDVFLVSPPTLGTISVGPLPSYAGRALSHSEPLVLIDKQGVVCNASVGKRVSKAAWTVEGCLTKSPISLGLVAIRESDATKMTRLELHSIGDQARINNNERPPPTIWDSTWEPLTIVDLAGDHKRQVAIHCRRVVATERECERFMVYRGRDNEVGWFVPVARARWMPQSDQ